MAERRPSVTQRHALEMLREGGDDSTVAALLELERLEELPVERAEKEAANRAAVAKTAAEEAQRRLSEMAADFRHRREVGGVGLGREARDEWRQAQRAAVEADAAATRAAAGGSSVAAERLGRREQMLEARRAEKRRGLDRQEAVAHSQVRRPLSSRGSLLGAVGLAPSNVTAAILGTTRRTRAALVGALPSGSAKELPEQLQAYKSTLQAGALQEHEGRERFEVRIAEALSHSRPSPLQREVLREVLAEKPLATLIKIWAELEPGVA